MNAWFTAKNSLGLRRDCSHHVLPCSGKTFGSKKYFTSENYLHFTKRLRFQKVKSSQGPKIIISFPSTANVKHSNYVKFKSINLSGKGENGEATADIRLWFPKITPFSENSVYVPPLVFFSTHIIICVIIRHTILLLGETSKYYYWQ